MSDEPDPRVPGRRRARDARTGSDAAAERARLQGTWVDLQVQRAIQRGDFEGLPGYGKPIEGLGEGHDPQWWVKRLVERERVSVLPPALAVRRDDAGLDDRLDAQPGEREARRELEEFNERVAAARIQPLGGPPMITRERDVEAELTRWRERRDVRRAEASRAAAGRGSSAGVDRSGSRRRRLRWPRRPRRPRRPDGRTEA